VDDRQSCRHDFRSLASDGLTVTTDELLEAIFNEPLTSKRGSWTIPGGYISCGANHHLLDNLQGGKVRQPVPIGVLHAG
jgi:hypothetical protein